MVAPSASPGEPATRPSREEALPAAQSLKDADPAKPLKRTGSGPRRALFSAKPSSGAGSGNRRSLDGAQGVRVLRAPSERPVPVRAFDVPRVSSTGSDSGFELRQQRRRQHGAVADEPQAASPAASRASSGSGEAVGREPGAPSMYLDGSSEEFQLKNKRQGPALPSPRQAANGGSTGTPPSAGPTPSAPRPSVHLPHGSKQPPRLFSPRSVLNFSEGEDGSASDAPSPSPATAGPGGAAGWAPPRPPRPPTPQAAVLHKDMSFYRNAFSDKSNEIVLGYTPPPRPPAGKGPPPPMRKLYGPTNAAGPRPGGAGAATAPPAQAPQLILPGGVGYTALFDLMREDKALHGVGGLAPKYLPSGQFSVDFGQHATAAQQQQQQQQQRSPPPPLASLAAAPAAARDGSNGQRPKEPPSPSHAPVPPPIAAPRGLPQGAAARQPGSHEPWTSQQAPSPRHRAPGPPQQPPGAGAAARTPGGSRGGGGPGRDVRSTAVGPPSPPQQQQPGGAVPPGGKGVPPAGPRPLPLAVAQQPASRPAATSSAKPPAATHGQPQHRGGAGQKQQPMLEEGRPKGFWACLGGGW